MDLDGYIKNSFGYCHYCFEKDDDRGDYVHIYDLYVFSLYRRCGEARKILQAAIDEIRATGYNGEIWIVANPKENSIELEDLVAFYKRMGLTVFDSYR